MSRYSHASIRAPKGESRGSGRNYRGQFTKSYLDTMNDRLAQKEADVVYLQRKFDESKHGKNADMYANMLDRARREVGQFEVIVAKAEREELRDEVAPLENAA